MNDNAMLTTARTWKTLTSEEDSIRHGSDAQYWHAETGVFPHHIEADCQELELTDGELDALIRVSGRWRQLPEVRALVEDATAIREAIEVDCAPYAPIHSLNVVGKVTLDASLIVSLLQHLAPFSEADVKGETDGHS